MLLMKLPCLTSLTCHESDGNVESPLNRISVPFNATRDPTTLFSLVCPLYSSSFCNVRPYDKNSPLLHRIEKWNPKSPCSLTPLTCYESDGNLESPLKGISMPFNATRDLTKSYLVASPRWKMKSQITLLSHVFMLWITWQVGIAIENGISMSFKATRDPTLLHVLQFSFLLMLNLINSKNSFDCVYFPCFLLLYLHWNHIPFFPKFQIMKLVFASLRLTQF